MSRNEVAVGTDSASVMFWARRAAAPVIGVNPWGIGNGEWGMVGASTPSLSPFPFPLSRSTSSGLVAITGRSAKAPLSNSFRHSSPTEAGSRRYCSYITCTKAALSVPNTNNTPAVQVMYEQYMHEGRIVRAEHELAHEGYVIKRILCAMKCLRVLALLLTGTAPAAASQQDRK